MRIEIISGSARKNSITKRVALALEKIFKERTEHEIGFIDLHDHHLPSLERVYISVEHTPQQYKPLAERIFNADTFILVSPEYNGSFTPALKNLLDHFPKQYHKVFGIVTASPGTLGGIRAAIQLQQLVYALFGIGSPHMLVVPAVDKKFNEDGKLLDPSFEKSINIFVNEFLWLAEKVAEEKVEA
jgi:NAD(P)H-dependent FMN reductase